jgi:hypothetical protein
MLELVLNTFKDCFLFVYNALQTIKLTENVSAWDFLLVCFVAGAIISFIMRSFGASGIVSGGSSAVDTYINARDRKHKDSYEHYANSRNRNREYERRYRNDVRNRL